VYDSLSASRSRAKAFDKLELTKLADRAGVATPVTVPATEQKPARHTLPIVVKSRLHWYPGAQGAPPVWKTTICSNRQEAHHRIDEIREGGGDPLLQELILGRIMHYHMVIDTSGHSIACVAQISEPDVLPPYTYPPVVGTRVRSISVRSDERLRACLESILRDIQWIGFASFQFMLPHQGDPMLVDFNGRIPASFQQSIAASSNLPHLWASIAMGKPIPTKPHTRERVRYQWLEGDLGRALKERRGGIIRDVFDCLAYARRAQHGIWSVDDPWPAVHYWAQLLGGSLRRFVSRRHDS
jgi:hypothetical protein